MTAGIQRSVQAKRHAIGRDQLQRQIDQRRKQAKKDLLTNLIGQLPAVALELGVMKQPPHDIHCNHSLLHARKKMLRSYGFMVSPERSYSNIFKLHRHYSKLYI